MNQSYPIPVREHSYTSTLTYEFIIYVNASSKKETSGTYLTISCGQLWEKRPFTNKFVCSMYVYPFPNTHNYTSYIYRKQAFYNGS